MAKQHTIDEVFSSEIKRDIAQRYFSFRKLIEDNEMDLKEKIRQNIIILEKRISFDLIRIYILLGKEEFIDTFLKLAGLDNKLFYDPYLLESAQISARVFRCQRFDGFTQSSRFVNFLLECYENLYFHVNKYHEHIEELEKEREMIVEEIKQFYKENNLSAILGFIHSLGDEEVCSCMRGEPEVGLTDELSRKMKIPTLPPLEKMMVILPQLSDPNDIHHDLKKMQNWPIRTSRLIFSECSTGKVPPVIGLGCKPVYNISQNLPCSELVSTKFPGTFSRPADQ